MIKFSVFPFFFASFFISTFLPFFLFVYSVMLSLFPQVIKRRKSHQKRQQYDNRFQLLVEFIWNPFLYSSCSEHLCVCVSVCLLLSIENGGVFKSFDTMSSNLLVFLYFYNFYFKGDVWVVVIVFSINLSAFAWTNITFRMSFDYISSNSGDFLSIDHDHSDNKSEIVFLLL